MHVFTKKPGGMSQNVSPRRGPRQTNRIIRVTFYGKRTLRTWVPNNTVRHGPSFTRCSFVGSLWPANDLHRKRFPVPFLNSLRAGIRVGCFSLCDVVGGPTPSVLQRSIDFVGRACVVVLVHLTSWCGSLQMRKIDDNHGSEGQSLHWQKAQAAKESFGPQKKTYDVLNRRRPNVRRRSHGSSESLLGIAHARDGDDGHLLARCM